jgi:hypothetical protein
LLPLAEQLGDADTAFESAIHGSSMSPAIPAHSRIKVRLGGTCQVGDIIFYLADGGYTVHRVVYRSRAWAGDDYLLAEGDARFAPDPPLTRRQVLGTVEAVQVDGRWHPLGRRSPGPWHRRIVRSLTLPAMIGAMWFGTAAANRLAAVLLSLESRARMMRRRLVRAARGTGRSD